MFSRLTKTLIDLQIVSFLICQRTAWPWTKNYPENTTQSGLIMLQDSESCHHATYRDDNYYATTTQRTCTWNTHDHDPLLPRQMEPASLATSAATERSRVESEETCGNAGKQL
ncbi:hypothetical protein Pelo_19072 [Pelomyxa schiedti]|nr:hypothetical protein Pelo_19072 [Pelomyxa schiedti]